MQNDRAHGGQVKLAGRTLTGAGKLISRSSEANLFTIWEDTSVEAAPIRYRLNTLTNELVIAGEGSTIVVKDFEGGDLGISAPAAESTTPTPPTAWTFDLMTAQGRTDYDHWMTGYFSPVPWSASVRFENVNATVNTVGVANGYLKVLGQDGDDTLVGGGSIPQARVALSGGMGDDRVFAGAERSLASAIEAGETEIATRSAALLLEGDAGDDELVGAAGNDVLMGGFDDDVLVGGAGDDIILADGQFSCAQAPSSLRR